MKITLTNTGSTAYIALIKKDLANGASVTLNNTTLDEVNKDTELCKKISAGTVTMAVTAESFDLPAVPLKVTLTAAAEAANARVVTGQVKTLDGATVAAVKNVLVEVYSPVVAKGQMTVSTGTSKVLVNDASGKVHRLWIETTAAGAFSVSVADDQVETDLIMATPEGGVMTALPIAFA